MDPKVQRLDILIYCSQPGGSWATNGPTGLLQSVGGLRAAEKTQGDDLPQGPSEPGVQRTSGGRTSPYRKLASSQVKYSANKLYA